MPTQLPFETEVMSLASKYEDLLFNENNLTPEPSVQLSEQASVPIQDPARQPLSEVTDFDTEDSNQIELLAKMLEDTRKTLKTMDIGQDTDENGLDPADSEESSY
jgi:hypothetical protein